MDRPRRSVPRNLPSANALARRDDTGTCRADALGRVYSSSNRPRQNPRIRSRASATGYDGTNERDGRSPHSERRLRTEAGICISGRIEVDAPVAESFAALLCTTTAVETDMNRN